VHRAVGVAIAQQVVGGALHRIRETDFPSNQSGPSFDQATSPHPTRAVSRGDTVLPGSAMRLGCMAFVALALTAGLCPAQAQTPAGAVVLEWRDSDKAFDPQAVYGKPAKASE